MGSSMQIRCRGDLERAVGEMHDSEFQERDFGVDVENKRFHIRSYSVEGQRREFLLELYNVEEYTPLNLERIRQGRAMGGVLDDIRVKEQGLDLTLVSQDLRIRLKLSKLEGKFEIRASPEEESRGVE